MKIYSLREHNRIHSILVRSNVLNFLFSSCFEGGTYFQARTSDSLFWGVNLESL